MSYERKSTGWAVVRALLGLLVFAVALGTAGVAGAGAERAGLTGNRLRLVPAGVLSAVAVPLVVLLWRRLDERPVALVGPRRRSVLVGPGVVLGTAAVVFGIGVRAGGLNVVSLDLATLLVFLVTNTVLALLLEAVPEELVFRGYVFAVLTRRWGSWTAAALTTALFLLSPAASGLVEAGLGRLLGVATGPLTFAPGGQDPYAYGILLVVFGAMLAAVRIATGSVLGCVGAHLAFLTTNRVLLPSPAFQTGVVTVAAPGAELLVVLYLLGATAVLAVLARRRARGPGAAGGHGAVRGHGRGAALG